jgi:peptidoglycan/LPS O-acetylase OafA/YrhL
VKLEEEYSLYLDCIRFLAALFVVIAHFIQYGILNPSFSYYVPELGREAVMIFFVLSGFVIAYTCDIKKPSISEYAIARAARIYSVALPVLLVSFLIVCIYSVFYEYEYYQISKAYIYIPFHSLFLGEIWNISETPVWLTPYWSLSYEVWYYILFASFYFYSGVKRVIISGIVFLFIGHKLWLLLPVWLAGVALYKYQKNVSLNIIPARLGWLLSILFLIVYKYLDLDYSLRVYGNEIWPFSFLNLGSADRYLNDYFLTFIVVLNFLCAKHSKFSLLLSYKNSIRLFSTYTFTLYLVHALVMSIWANLYTHDSNSIVDIFLLISAIGISTYIFGQLTEHRKYLFNDFFSYAYKKTLGNFHKDAKSQYLITKS